MKLLTDKRMQRRGLEAKRLWLNLKDSLRNLPALMRGFIVTSAIVRSMRQIASSHLAEDQIPRIFHFVIISSEPCFLQFYAFTAIATALHYNPGWTVILHATFEPTGLYWQKIARRVQLNVIPPFEYYGIARLFHGAHKADVIRLLALREIGGVYLDTDTITVKSFEPLLNEQFVMGVQSSYYDAPPGLCNATLLGRRHAKFVRIWCRRYVTFRSKGRDKLWDYHSGRIPALLSWYHPNLIKILPFDRFFYPLWSDVERVLLDGQSARWLPYLQNAFCFHLWSGFTSARLLSVDEKFVLTSKSVYAHYARPALEDF